MGPIEATSQSVKLVQICSNQFDHVQSYLWKARSQHLATVHSSVTDFQKHCLQVLGRRIQPESMAHVSHRTVRISVVDVWNYTNIYKDMRTNIHLISTLSGTKPLVLDKLNTRIQASGPARNNQKRKNASGCPKDICMICHPSLHCGQFTAKPGFQATCNWEICI